MIKLYQLPPVNDVFSVSIFCAKLEAFLRWQKIPHEVINTRNMRAAPKGKIPYIEYQDEQNRTIKLGDSNFIMEYLIQAYKLDPDAHLTLEQRAQARAIRYLCEESLYWEMSYFRWVDPQGQEIIRRNAFNQIPAPIRFFVVHKIVKYVTRQIFSQGTGRHRPEEIARNACADLKALSDLLGNKAYFFGDQMSTADLFVFSVVGNFVSASFADPVSQFARNQQNLVMHVNRVREVCFGVKANTIAKKAA